MSGPRRLEWDALAPGDTFDRIESHKETQMNVMESYAEGLSDKALLALARTNLVESQMRYVRAEVERRGLEDGNA